ncbi:hypothetical protein [Actinomycetospora sp.]|jgi:hypothetical protein
MDIATLKDEIVAQVRTSRQGEGHWLGMAAFRWGFPLLEMMRRNPGTGTS